MEAVIEISSEAATAIGDKIVDGLIPGPTPKVLEKAIKLIKATSNFGVGTIKNTVGKAAEHQ